MRTRWPEGTSAHLVRARTRDQSKVSTSPRGDSATGTLSRFAQLSAMTEPRRIKVIVAFAALYVIWGSTYLGILFAIQSIPPFLMAGARFFLAGLIMFAIARIYGPLRSTWAEWRTALIVGACLLLGGNGGVTLSEKFIESGLASLIVATVPIYITLLGWLSGMTPRPA